MRLQPSSQLAWQNLEEPLKIPNQHISHLFNRYKYQSLKTTNHWGGYVLNHFSVRIRNSLGSPLVARQLVPNTFPEMSNRPRAYRKNIILNQGLNLSHVPINRHYIYMKCNHLIVTSSHIYWQTHCPCTNCKSGLHFLSGGPHYKNGHSSKATTLKPIVKKRN